MEVEGKSVGYLHGCRSVFRLYKYKAQDRVTVSPSELRICVKRRSGPMFAVTNCPNGPCGRQATLKKKKTFSQASSWNSFKENVEETWTNAGARAHRLYIPAEIEPPSESKGPGLYLNETERSSERSRRINAGDSGLCCCACVTSFER